MTEGVRTGTQAAHARAPERDARNANGRLFMHGRRVRLKLALAGPPETTRQMVEAFRFLMLETRLEAGCLGCTVWMDQDSNVHYVEEWANEIDMYRRVRSDAFTSLLAVMEAAREPPHLQFDFIDCTRGLDYVAEVREGQAS